MSYRLESPRPRASLPPIRIRSNVPSSLGSPTTLLYDLPQPSSRSPPPQSADALLYTGSPLKSPALDSPHHSRPKARATPPPHSRSATPAQATQQEQLRQFEAHCHAWYFDQDGHAGQMMTQTIESLSASQRAPFARSQANIRSSYHTAMTRRRRTEFRAHLSSTHPGGSLLPSSRGNPTGQAAKKERYHKFDKFLRTWCTTGMPGTKPFFQGLWCLLRLQVLPVDLGGAGSRRIEWEVDDAVFQESAGKEFMLEAIDILKGVLGFDEYLPAPSRRQSDELHSPVVSTFPIQRMSPTGRPRSPSDPFLDTPALSHSTTTSASRSPTFTATFPLAHSTPDEIGQQTPPGGSRESSLRAAPPGRMPFASHKEPPDIGDGESVDDSYLRIWTSGDLDNPELQSLISLIPEFIMRQSLSRFPTPQSRRTVADLEEGMDIAEEPREIHCGTGRLWVGDKERREGWRGSWWHRFTGWWRRLFC